MFRNAGEYAALYPDAAPAPARFCAPRVIDGAAYETVRILLTARAASAPRHAPATHTGAGRMSAASSAILPAAPKPRVRAA
jgi:hypothetical protein